MSDTVAIPDDVEPLGRALLNGLKGVLREKLFAVYLYGAIAFPEGGASGDLDFHVILTEAPDSAQRQALQDLHSGLAQDYPPLGAELDGWYILLEDALRPAPPPHQLVPGLYDGSWALHRAHLRAGRCVNLHGPEPAQYLAAPSWPELENALQGELDYVKAHLADAPAYCVLNLCRLIYSFATRDVVVSKRASAAWAVDRFPEWQHLVAAALHSYDQQASRLDQDLLASDVAVFLGFAAEQIRSNRTAAGSAECGAVEPGVEQLSEFDLCREKPGKIW